MAEQSVRGKMAEPSAIPDPRAQTLAMQGVANRVVRGLLRTPLLSRAAGGRLVTLYITGRKSGRRYTVPVAYTRQGDDLLIGTPFGWGRNLRTGEPVEIRLKGRLRQADVRVYSGEADVTGRTRPCAGTTGSSRSSTRSGSTPRVTPIPTTCTWPGWRGRARSG